MCLLAELEPPVQGAVRRYATRVQDGVRRFFVGSIDRRIVGRPGSAGASSLKLAKTPKIQIMTVAELLHRACEDV
jgi:hypothetical protein